MWAFLNLKCFLFYHNPSQLFMHETSCFLLNLPTQPDPYLAHMYIHITVLSYSIHTENIFEASETDGGRSLQPNLECIWQPLEHLPFPFALMPTRWLCGKWYGHDTWRIQVCSYRQKLAESIQTCEIISFYWSLYTDFTFFVPCIVALQTLSTLCTTWRKWCLMIMMSPLWRHWRWPSWTTGEKSEIKLLYMINYSVKLYYRNYTTIKILIVLCKHIRAARESFYKVDIIGNIMICDN